MFFVRCLMHVFRLQESHEIAKEQVDYKLMSNFLLLASKQKTDAELALSEFIKILNTPGSVSFTSTEIIPCLNY